MDHGLTSVHTIIPWSALWWNSYIGELDRSSEVKKNMDDIDIKLINYLHELFLSKWPK